MATTLHNPVTTKFHGHVGPYIYYVVRNQQRIRSMPSKVHNPRSPKQTAHRTRFSAANSLAATFRDTVAAPASGSRQIELSVGMPNAQILEVGNLFFSKYSGITDEAEFADYYKRLGLLCSLNAVFTPGAGAESAVSHAESLMENVLRPQVLPNEETIKGLLQTM
jgi:hypothetical protein